MTRKNRKQSQSHTDTNEPVSSLPQKRLLIYAHYYIPDTASTGQILKELAEGLLDTFDVTVICVVPSYLGTIEEKYRTHHYYKEEINGVKILRIRVSEFDKTKMYSRIWNILGYFFGAMGATFQVGRMDYVFSISQPPILGGLIGVWGKWMKHAKYIYNIQDFNPEQTIAVGYTKNKAILGLMMWLDKFSCRRSNLIITVGRDLGETIEKRFSGKNGTRGRHVPNYTIINNWINENAIYPLEKDDENVLAFRRKYGLEDKFVFMYSGNIGLYYDLEGILKVIRKFKGVLTADGKEAIFAFVGAGSILDKMAHYTRKHQMTNVVFIPYQPIEDLIYSLNAADVQLCVNAKGIKGVSCPSKFYGLAAAGKPILGVLEKGTEVRCLIEETGCGMTVEPGDYQKIEAVVRWFIEQDGKGRIKDDIGEKGEGRCELEMMGRRGRELIERSLTEKVSVEKYERAMLGI